MKPAIGILMNQFMVYSPVSRVDAKRLGLMRYFTGKPCKQGHIRERQVSNGTCFGCKAIADVKSQRKNKAAYYIRHKRWRDRNLDKVHAWAKRWQLDNPSMNSVKSRNYYAKMRGNGGKHTHQDIIEMLALQANKCCYCGTVLTRKNMHVDHIVPVSAGGSNGRDNLQILCGYCNRCKADRDELVYCKMIGIKPPKRGICAAP